MDMRSISRSFKVVAAVLFSSICMSQLQAQSFLSEYFETAAAAIPNRLTLSAFEEVRYNDNIHDSATRRVGSFINECGLSLDWYKNYENGKYGIIGDISYEYYDKDSHDENEFKWNLSPFILGGIDLLGNDRLMLTLSSRSINEKYDTSDTNHTTHIDNTIGLTYDMLKFARWGVALSAKYFNKHYTDSDYKDKSYQQYSFGVAPYYNLTEKIKLGIHNSYKEKVYKNNKSHDDSKTYAITPFIDYRQSSKFSAHLGAGLSRTEYKGRSKGTNGDGDWKPVANLTLRYFPVSNFYLTYFSDVEWEDTGSGRGGRMSYFNSLRATWQLTHRISFSPGVSIEIQDERNATYDSTEYSAFANLDYKISKRFSTYLGYEYEHTKYKYLSNRDYEVNEVWLGVKFTY